MMEKLTEAEQERLERIFTPTTEEIEIELELKAQWQAGYDQGARDERERVTKFIDGVVADIRQDIEGVKE